MRARSINPSDLLTVRAVNLLRDSPVWRELATTPPGPTSTYRPGHPKVAPSTHAQAATNPGWEMLVAVTNWLVPATVDTTAPS